MSTENTFEILFECLLGISSGAPHEREALLQNLDVQPLLQDLRRMVNGLPHTLDLQPAPAEVKARIFAAIKNEETATRGHAPEMIPTSTHAPAHASPAGSLYIQRRHEGAWLNPGIPGVAFKNLFIDHNTGYTTRLVRMEPNSWFPMHRHAGYEECLMLEGEVSCGEILLFAGDYQRMTGDTVHEPLHTKTGCTFLVMASEHNELI